VLIFVPRRRIRRAVLVFCRGQFAVIQWRGLKDLRPEGPLVLCGACSAVGLKVTFAIAAVPIATSAAASTPSAPPAFAVLAAFAVLLAVRIELRLRVLLLMFRRQERVVAR
jgi:hypothetical protein